MHPFRNTSANHLAAFNDPYLELVMARRKEEARWGWIPFAAFVSFLFVYRIFGLFMPSNDADGSDPGFSCWRWQAGGFWRSST